MLKSNKSTTPADPTSELTAPHTRSGFTDTLISDFTAPQFQAAFKAYFTELNIAVKDWDGLFREMNDEGANRAFVRTSPDGTAVGFIQFTAITFTSWFFEGTCGFIREFWVSAPHRNSGHGTDLLRLAEEYFREQRLYTSILTTDTARRFYLARGYITAPGCKAKNNDEVFIKHLR